MRVFILTVAATWAIAASALAAPLETYAQLPLIEVVALSDDGTQIAIAMNDGHNHKVLVRPVSGPEGSQFIELGSNRIGALAWRTGDELIIGTVFTVYGPDGSTMMRSLRPHIYDLKTKKLDVRTPGKSTSAPPRWPYDDNFRPTVYVTYEQPTGRWNLRYDEKVVATGIQPFGPPRLLAKGKAPDSVLLMMDGGDGAVTRELDLKSGQFSDPVKLTADIGVFVDRNGELFGTKYWAGEEQKVDFLRKDDQAMWETLKKSFPNDHIDIVSWSLDHKIVIVSLDGRGAPPAYVLVDLNTKKASFIASRWGGIGKADVAPVTAITYKAADGLDIPAYLTLPNGKAAKGLPLVVLAHGGPAVRDTATYDWWVQALASRGYAVLQSNFRGSEGYGEPFQRAGFGEFGRKMQTDLSDGVRHLAKEGIVDPKRVCIMGASYGGYAALAGAAFDKGVYRCAAAFAGVSDLETQIAPDGGKGKNATGRYFARYLGAENAYDKIVDAYSPAKHAENIDIPVLLIHGKDDLTVYYEQSQSMDRAMRKAGKPVEFLTLKGEDHSLTLAETRLQMLTAIVAFLEKNNPPD